MSSMHNNFCVKDTGTHKHAATVLQVTFCEPSLSIRYMRFTAMCNREREKIPVWELGNHKYEHRTSY